VSFALRHAIDAARRDNGLKEEFYLLSPPLNPEKILLASGNKVEDYKIY
jgi:hypothetical protein